MASQSSVSITHWVICALILFVLGLWLYQLFGPNPKLVVSRQTTYLITPLKPDGYPDYAAVVKAKQKEGVTPENNGALPFWRAMWPTATAENQWAPRFLLGDEQRLCKEIGLTPIPDGSEAASSCDSDQLMIEAGNWIVSELQKASDSETKSRRLAEAWDRLRSTFEEEASFGTQSFYSESEEPSIEESLREAIWRLIEIASERPWEDSGLPFMATWLSTNEDALELLVEAFNASHWYSPRQPEFERAATLLSVRAMNRIGSGRYESAWRDIHACWKLSAHLGQSVSFRDQIDAIYTAQRSLEKTMNLLSDPGVSETVALRVRNDLRQLPRLVKVANGYTIGERLEITEILVDMALQKDPPKRWAEDYGDFRDYRITSLDWNLVLRRLQSHYDILVKALAESDYVARHQALADLTSASQLRQSNTSSLGWINKMAWRQVRSKAMADALFDSYTWGVGYRLAMEEKIRTERKLLTVAAELVAYHAREGVYPESLKELPASQQEQAKTDLYHGKPFQYKPVKDGFLLYSCGPNGTDDGGSRITSYGATWYQGRWLTNPKQEPDREAEHQRLLKLIPADADDISLRFPVELEPWPALPKASGQDNDQ